MKQHEVLHTQEWEALIEEVATAEVNTDDEIKLKIEEPNQSSTQNTSEINTTESSETSLEQQPDLASENILVQESAIELVLENVNNLETNNETADLKNL